MNHRAVHFLLNFHVNANSRDSSLQVKRICDKLSEMSIAYISTSKSNIKVLCGMVDWNYLHVVYTEVFFILILILTILHVLL